MIAAPGPLQPYSAGERSGDALASSRTMISSTEFATVSGRLLILSQAPHS